MANRQKMKKPSLEWIEETLSAFFKDRSEVVLAYLFGSYLTRTGGIINDIDIAVFINPDRLNTLDRMLPYGYSADLSVKLANILHYEPVDVTLLNYGSPLLVRRAIGSGKLVFCRCEADRIRFEVTSLKRYADTASIRKIKRFYMNQRIEEGLAAYG